MMAETLMSRDDGMREGCENDLLIFTFKFRYKGEYNGSAG